ncbi:hypothetical protein [Pontibacter qinzhouensis]|uniref:hypothetical protein n=1 Tax=Pontibacter qinzhouensis TaxID=2603253 RepID=UPI00165021D3|nr:hypothetical protein [Pontibacter qinzhouensis]
MYDHLRLSQPYNIHIAFYKGFLFDFKEELDRLLQHPGVELSQTERQEMEKAIHFDTLKKENPKHLKKGASG